VRYLNSREKKEVFWVYNFKQGKYYPFVLMGKKETHHTNSGFAPLWKKELPDRKRKQSAGTRYGISRYELHIVFDGDAGGTPGDAIGAVLLDDGKKVGEISKNIGIGTNNIVNGRLLLKG